MTDNLSAPGTGLIGIESIAFNYVDGDGDTASSDIDFYVTQYDEIVGTDSAETITGTASSDFIDGLDGDDDIDAGGDNDVVYGREGSDTIDGGAGDDMIFAGDDADMIDGGTGDDTLLGGGGIDILIGGQGDDTLTGGAEADTFRFMSGDGGIVGDPAVDIITDFTIGDGGDVLDLTDLLQGESSGDIPGLANYLSFSSDGADTTISVDPDAGSGVTQEIVLEGVDLTAGGMTDQQILTDLLSNNNLITDT